MALGSFVVVSNNLTHQAVLEERTSEKVCANRRDVHH